MSLWERINAAFFQSVTPRTAGFNTVDLTGLSQPAQLLIILLMLVGGYYYRIHKISVRLKAENPAAQL